MEDIVVLMSTFNGEVYVSEQIESILNQIGVSVHILIRDDGSIDHTPEIIEKYSEIYPQKIKFIRGENCGFANSFSKLVSIALEEYPYIKYFSFSDQDDIWLSDKLISAINQIENRELQLNKPIVYCSNTKLVNNDLQEIGLGWDPERTQISKESSLIQNYATGCTMVFNRIAADYYRNFMPQKLRVHDFYLYQLGIFLGIVIWDPIPHILYRQHGTNQIGRPNLIGRMKNRLKGNFRRHILEGQNRNLYKAICSQLSLDDKNLFLKFINYRDNIASKLSLLFDFKIHHSSIESDFFYRIKIIFGWV